MAPLVPIFSTSELPERIQIVHSAFKEKRRKGEPIDLHKCALMELIQYSCNPPSEGINPPGVVKCKPVVRLFRRYNNPYAWKERKTERLIIVLCRCAGGLTVETTDWERLGDNTKVEERS
jgi:hypothetical protein